MGYTEVVAIEKVEEKNLQLHASQKIDFISLNEDTLPQTAENFSLGAFLGLAVGAATSFLLLPDQADVAFTVATTLFGGFGTVIGMARASESYIGEKLEELGNFRTNPQPQGMWKSFLIGGAKRHPEAYIVKGTKVKPYSLQDHKHSGSHTKNIDQVSYTIKRVPGGVEVYSNVMPHPMESWDKLYFDETGKYINSSRSEAEEYYKNLSEPSTSDIVVAKMSRGVHRMRKIPVPLWLEDAAGTSKKTR